MRLNGKEVNEGYSIFAKKREKEEDLGYQFKSEPKKRAEKKVLKEDLKEAGEGFLAVFLLFGMLYLMYIMSLN